MVEIKTLNVLYLFFSRIVSLPSTSHAIDAAHGSGSVEMSSIFINTYQLYKKQTNQLAQWLLDTAIGFGYLLEGKPSRNATEKELTLSTGQSATSARAKGKNRKGSRGQSNEKPISDSTSRVTDGRPNSIRLSQFVELARAIAERAKENFIIPMMIVNLVQQIITMRRKVSDYYKMQSRNRADDYDFREDNHKHRHFISQLEEVLEIFQSLSESPAQNSTQPREKLGPASKKTEEISMNALSNRFDALEVEDPVELVSDDDDGSEGFSARQKSSQVHKAQDVVYDASESEDDETDFAIFCLFEDLRRIRMYLNQIWQDYKSGKIDLMAASVISNAAFGFVQNVHSEFGRSHPNLLSSKFHQNPIFPIYMASCIKIGADFNLRAHPDDLYNYEMQHFGEFIYLPVYVLLEAFDRVLKPNHIPLAKKGLYGTYNPTSDREKMSYRQKMAEDKIILLEMLPMYCVLSNAEHGLFALDELTNGLANLCRKKEIPAWLVFATQVFLDINHIMRDRVGDTYLQLKRTAVLTKINMTRVMDSPVHSMNWSRQNQNLIKDIWTVAHEWIFTDGFDKMSRAFYSARLPSYKSEPFALLRSHPLLCGTIQASLILLNSEAGIMLSLAWGTILYVGHLYNALRQSHVFEVEWPDMELFISIHTAKRLFVGDLPTTIEDCKKRYDIMMGAALENFAKNKKNHKSEKLVRSKTGPRNWQTESPIIRTIKARYMSQRGSIAWSAQNIQDILTEPSQQGLPQHLHNRWNQSHHLSHLQALELLRSALTSEHKALRYDYISMHIRCLEFLRALRNEIDEDLKTLFAPDYLEREDQLSTLVGYVFIVAVMFERVEEAVKDHERPNIAECSLVSKSAALLKNLIVESGDVELKKLL